MFEFIKTVMRRSGIRRNMSIRRVDILEARFFAVVAAMLFSVLITKSETLIGKRTLWNPWP